MQIPLPSCALVYQEDQDRPQMQDAAHLVPSESSLHSQVRGCTSLLTASPTYRRKRIESEDQHKNT